MELTAERAIELTLEIREAQLRHKAYSRGWFDSRTAILKEAGIYTPVRPCPLCVYARQQVVGDEACCDYCPIALTTGAFCNEHDESYHHRDCEAGISLILYVMYEWDRLQQEQATEAPPSLLTGRKTPKIMSHGEK